MAIEINCQPLPCAAIQEDIDDYIGRLDQFYSCKLYQSLHRTKENKYILTSSNIDSNFNVGVVSKYNSIPDIAADKIELYLNPRYGPCCSQSAYVNQNDSLLAGFDNGFVSLIECENLSLLENRMMFHDNIRTLKLSADEKYAIAGDISSRIAVIDLDDFRPVHYYDPAHASMINDLAFHPEDDRIFVSVAGNELLLWDVRSRIPASELIVTSTTPTSVIFPSPDRVFFSTEGGKIIDFDLKSRKPQKIVSFKDKDIPVSRLQLVDNEKTQPKKIAVLPDIPQCNDTSVTFMDFNLQEIKSWHFPEKTVSNIFIDSNTCFALGEERLFQELSF